jgi:hypothetical protein
MDFAQFVPTASLIAEVSLASRFANCRANQIAAFYDSTERLTRKGLRIPGTIVLNAQVERSRCFIQSASASSISC